MASIPTVRYIACANMAGFVMDFTIWVENVDEDEVPFETGRSDVYPIDQTRVLDLSTLDLRHGPDSFSSLRLRPYVHARGGSDILGNRPVKYDPNSTQTATYEVRGTTITFSVNRIGGDS